jgi:hypothetical protein
VRIAITDAASLLDACDHLHDCNFALDSVSFDAESATWSGIFFRPAFDEPSLATVRHGWLRDRTTVPVFEAPLELEGVVGYDLSDRSRIGLYRFNECRVVPGGYEFAFHEEMELLISFRGAPQGLLHDARQTEATESMSSFRARTERLTSAST